jgi:ABC-type multidrug transport system fused ATPase/permease subunit
MAHIRSLLLIRAGNNAVAFSLPAIAAVVSFVVYGATGHTLEPANVFTALTLFNLVRLPLMWMPMGLSAIADAASAVERLHDVFVAEVITDTRKIDPTLDAAIKVEKATFAWDGSNPEEEDSKKKHKYGAGAGADAPKQSRDGNANTNAGADSSPASGTVEPTYKLENINFTIPRGQLCAIVGAIGSGKSSLLQGLIGEMRRTSGNVAFGGSVSYCPQTAWIQVSGFTGNCLCNLPTDLTEQHPECNHQG